MYFTSGMVLILLWESIKQGLSYIDVNAVVLLRLVLMAQRRPFAVQIETVGFEMPPNLYQFFKVYDS
jgi:hypothetical protein